MIQTRQQWDIQSRQAIGVMGRKHLIERELSTVNAQYCRRRAWEFALQLSATRVAGVHNNSRNFVVFAWPVRRELLW